VSASTTKRPKRLWVMVGMNVLVTAINLGTILYLLLGSSVPAAFAKTPISAISSAALPVILLTSSIFCLWGYRTAHAVTLTAALLFYGTVCAQHVAMLLAQDSNFTASVVLKLRAGVLRSLIEIGVNLWALLSPKTRSFFSASAIAPNYRLERP